MKKILIPLVVSWVVLLLLNCVQFVHSRNERKTSTELIQQQATLVKKQKENIAHRDTLEQNMRQYITVLEQQRDLLKVNGRMAEQVKWKEWYNHILEGSIKTAKALTQHDIDCSDGFMQLWNLIGTGEDVFKGKTAPE